MTSSSFKRSLEYDLAPATLTLGATNGANVDNANQLIDTFEGPVDNCYSNVVTESNDGSLHPGRNKRRCTYPRLVVVPSSSSSSPLKPNVSETNSRTLALSRSNDLSNRIKQEIENCIKASNNHSESNNQAITNDPPVLTARQAQAICESIINEREQYLKSEYDKMLASKLADQYNLVNKVNFINSTYGQAEHGPRLASPSSITTIPPIPPTATSLLPSQTNHAPVGGASMNVLAAAINSMQRSAAVGSAANPTNLQDLSNLAALTAVAAAASNVGHHEQSHHHHHHAPYQPGASLAASQLAHNLQQQAAALQVHQHRVQQVTGGICATPTGGIILSGPVLLASSLDEQLATPEALFTLFGVFGDVIRVKILFNKKDNALIQMADANQAQVAQGYLDKQRIFGKTIRVTRSKHQLVQMPRDGNQSDTGLTKDFTNSPLHRFKIPGSRNYLNIYPPSSTLHISNIPANIEEKDIQIAFKEACSFDFCSFKFFPKDRKMALMTFSTIEHATIALIRMHNFQISEENNLKVSFSKSMSQQ